MLSGEISAGAGVFGAAWPCRSQRRVDCIDRGIGEAKMTTDIAKPKPISRKVRDAISIMVTGDSRTITAAAEKVGITREHLSRELSKPHIAEFLNQKVRRHLAIATTRAGAVKADLLDCNNALVQDRASTFILGLAGIAPASQPNVNLNLSLRAGFIIDLSEPGDTAAAAKVIGPEPVRQIEHEPNQPRLSQHE
jgi:hypothetical protein